jgi:hypothetical protein
VQGKPKQERKSKGLKEPKERWEVNAIYGLWILT